MTRLMHYLSKSQKRNGNQLLSSWDSKIKCGTDCANKKGLYIKKREQKMKESAIDLGTEITALSMSSTNDRGYRESMNGTYGNWQICMQCHSSK